jgi:ElaB/YqjD/DUF883 family membrane-anchored ribosome-binding protein
MNTVSREQLAADLTTVIKDSEALLKATVSDAKTQAGGVRERLEDSLTTARARVARIEDAAIARSRAAAEKTDRYVHENPWPSIGVAAAVGVLLGLLFGRR